MTTDRTKQILGIAKANALEGLDQGRIADYEDNMRDALAGMGCTADEAAIAETEFNRIAGR